MKPEKSLLDEAREEINRIDGEMARLFVERMRAAEKVAKYKKEVGMPIFDPVREEEVIRCGSARVEDETLRGYYVNFLHANMDISKAYQSRLLAGMRVAYSGVKGAMILTVKTALSSYPIVLERGVLKKASEHLKLDRKCLILTDENIPKTYVNTLAKACKEPHIFVIPAGEDTKCLDTFGQIIEEMLKADFSRTDCVVALGGGVVGDLGGFVAASFQRGIDFYNVPTTVLSQVDSSIGGKVAVNFKGWKNMVGAFYPPKAVLIDPETLASLPQRQIVNGLAESLKMSLTFDAELCSLFERGEAFEKIDEVIEKSLRIKKRVVEEDEREAGLRKVLNFGHTLAHAVETESHKTREPLYHGECVAAGMIPMCAPAVRERLLPVLEGLGLPTAVPFSGEVLVDALRHDKKISGSDITLICVEKIGEFVMKKMPFSDFAEKVKEDFR